MVKCIKFECPLNGKCEQDKVIYQAIVKPGPQKVDLTDAEKAQIKEINCGRTWTPNKEESYIGKQVVPLKLGGTSTSLNSNIDTYLALHCLTTSGN